MNDEVQMTTVRRIVIWAILICVHLCSSAALAQNLQRYETPYYILHTDVPRDQAQEAAVRMTRMAEEYHNRTREFSGVITTKFPFYLYRERADYETAGGLPKSAGFFNGEALHAYVGAKTDDRTWHTVQHEGFHQFTAAVIGGD